MLSRHQIKSSASELVTRVAMEQCHFVQNHIVRSAVHIFLQTIWTADLTNHAVRNGQHTCSSFVSNFLACWLNAYQVGTRKNDSSLSLYSFSSQCEMNCDLEVEQTQNNRSKPLWATVLAFLCGTVEVWHSSCKLGIRGQTLSIRFDTNIIHYSNDVVSVRAWLELLENQTT